MGASAGNPRRRSHFTQYPENTFLGISSRDRSRTGWRAFLDPGAWIRSLLLTAVFVVLLSALACVVGFARDTTGHDWYAAGKLTWAEILLGLNFDPRAPVRYRTREGKEVTIARGDLWFSGEALLARAHLFRTAKRAAWIGAWCGLGAALMCLVLIRWLENELGERRASREPRRMRPGSGSPTPAATAPLRTPADRPPGPDASQPRKQQPAATEHRKAVPGGEDAPVPAPRKRDYERWI